MRAASLSPLRGGQNVAATTHRIANDSRQMRPREPNFSTGASQYDSSPGLSFTSATADVDGCDAGAVYVDFALGFVADMTAKWLGMSPPLWPPTQRVNVSVTCVNRDPSSECTAVRNASMSGSQAPPALLSAAHRLVRHVVRLRAIFTPCAAGPTLVDCVIGTVCCCCCKPRQGPGVASRWHSFCHSAQGAVLVLRRTQTHTRSGWCAGGSTPYATGFIA